MIERDLQRWSRQVAEDPAAPAFVRLARAYRRQGRRDAARDVVLAGLERNPEHVEAHALLALLHMDDGDRQRAEDEWHTILRLDPGNFDARRGLGFLALERGELEAARQNLEAAARVRPGDPAVRQARTLLERRMAAAAANGGAAPERRQDGPAPRRRSDAPDADRSAPGSAPAAAADPAPSPRTPPHARPPTLPDPARLFASLSGDGPFLGALLLDEHGLELAGAVEPAGGEPHLLAGMLSTVVAEAKRATDVLGLGAWEGMLLDAASVMLHVAPVDRTVLVMVAGRAAPAGWVLRIADRARVLAREFLEATP